MMAQISAKTPAATVTHNGDCQYVNKLFPHVGEFNARKDPKRATVKFKPNAKDNSLPLNHRAITVVIATIIDSAPRPKTNLPAAIKNISPVMAVMIAPIIIRNVKMRTDFRVPIRSIKIPPTSTMIMLGKL